MHMYAASCSPSEGAWTIGNPMSPMSSLADSLTSSVILEVCWAFVRAVLRSPRSTASLHSFSASSRRAFLSSRVARFRGWGLPSNTKIGSMPASTRLALLCRSPVRCEVVLPLLSQSGYPSGWRMADMNW